MVYRSNDASHARDGGKLGPKWEGSYEVAESLGKGAYKLKDYKGNELPRTWNIFTSATNVRDFEKCMLELKTMNHKAHEWLNKIPAEHWARSHFSGRAKSDLLLNNIYEVFNGKIVGGRDKPVIILLEYIREYCMKRIVNVQGVIDKCTGPLTPTATRIMESIKKDAHLMK
ncbi:hypothetical protein Tco_0491736 [Tanacetum coccineum]